MNNTYVIIPVNDVTLNMISACVQTDITKLRRTLDGTLTVLKYDNGKPAVLNAYTDYTHAQILVEMAKLAWQDASILI